MPIDLWYIIPALVTAGCYFAQWCYTQARAEEPIRVPVDFPFRGITLGNQRAVAPSVVHARGAFGLGGPMCGGAAASLLMNDGMRAQQNVYQQHVYQQHQHQQAFLVQQHAVVQARLHEFAANSPGRLIKVDDLHGVGVFKMPTMAPFPEFPEMP